MLCFDLCYQIHKHTFSSTVFHYSSSYRVSLDYERSDVTSYSQLPGLEDVPRLHLPVLHPGIFVALRLHGSYCADAGREVLTF